MADTTQTTEAPLTNSTEARTADGTLKDQAQTDTTTATTQEKVVKDTAEGTTLLTEGDKTEAEKKDAATGAPEKYEPFTPPEGHEYTLESVAEASAVFKELGLNQTQAQRLMDEYAKRALAAGEASTKAYNDMREGWQKETRNDPEIGKKLTEVKVTIGRALDSLGDKTLTDNFKAAMDLTGAGDHPAFVKAFYKLAQAVVEGGHVTGKGPSALGQSANGQDKRPTAAQAMYPNLPSSNS